MIKTYFKEKRVVDKKYLVSLRGKKCISRIEHDCRQPTYGHHSLQCPHKGMGIKGGDNHAFTVCDNLHREIHANGNEQEVLERHGIDFDILEYCDEQYRKYKQNSV